MTAAYAESVEIASHFYRKEVQMYARPVLGFWREVLQNSIDAGATIVNISIDGNNVTISDDGCGMTEETLRNVFFRIGETSKTGTDSIGGIGRARIIICFGQESYRIRTKDNCVTGSGGRFTIAKQKNFAGCSFQIATIWDETKLNSELTELLGTCLFTKLKVIVNGAMFKDYENKTSRKTYGLTYENEQFATAILINKPKNSVNAGRVLVRCRGLTMATNSHMSSFEGTVIVDVGPEHVRKVMTHNRDNFAYPYSSGVYEFLKTFGRNKATMLQPKPAQDFSKVFMTSRDCWIGPRNSVERSAGYGSGNLVSSFGSLSAPIADEKIDERFNIIIQDNTNSVALKRKIEQFYPTNLSAPKRKLLGIWTDLVLEQIDLLYKLFPEFPGFNLSVGFVFSDSVEAICKKADNGYALLFNPLVGSVGMAKRKLGNGIDLSTLTSEIGNDRYRMSVERDMHYLKTLAMHEVCHLVHMDHGEEYANLLTDLIFANMVGGA